MKVQLGCGHRRWPEWVNVDGNPESGADLIADLRAVEFPPASCSEVAAIHVLEHLASEECESLVARVSAWLQPGGAFTVEMPCRAKCLRLISGEALLPQRDKLWGDAATVGLGGLLGGRSGSHEAWVSWLRGHCSEIVAGVSRGDYESFLPAEWNLVRENHRRVWTTAEFKGLLLRSGFSGAREVRPQFHGGRYWRDMRIVGTK